MKSQSIDKIEKAVENILPTSGAFIDELDYSVIEQKKADWILNGGIEKEWDSYLKKMEQYGLSDYLAIKQKYFDKYQESLKSEQGKE